MSSSSAPISARWGRLSVSSVETSLCAKGCGLTLQILFVASNALIFFQAARMEWMLNDGYQRYLLAVARGFGQLVNFNLAVLLLFSSRALSSLLRETDVRFILPLDHILPSYHSKVGTLLCVSGTIHSAAQLVEYGKRSVWTRGFEGGTSKFISGILILLAFLLIMLSILGSVRRKYFEYFYILHIAGSWGCIALTLLHGSNRGSMTSWKWVVGPLAIYVLDRAMGVMRTRRSHLLISKNTVGFHGPNILHLRMQKLFHHEAGQYMEIRVPEISRWEWHPFTIASAPHESETALYIKVAGGWTSRLHDIFSSQNTRNDTDDVEVHVRGPFGAPTQHVGEYDRVILIGAGVGATPFCSIAKHLHYLLEYWKPQHLRQLTSTQHHLRDDRRTPEEERVNRSSSLELEEVPSVPTHTETVNIQLNRAGLLAVTPHMSSSVEESHSLSHMSSSNNDTFYTARDGNTLSISLSSDNIATAAPALVRERTPNRNIGISHERSSSEEIEQRPHPRNREDTMVSSRGRSVEYMEALNSVYSMQRILDTHHTSLNMLVGMNYGSLALVKRAQFRQVCADSKRTPSNASTLERPAGLNIFRSPIFMFLLFMRSVTMTFVAVWIMAARFLNIGFAVSLGKLSLIEPGLRIFQIQALAIVDFICSTLLCVLIIVPMFLELREVGVTGGYVLEDALLALILITGSTCDTLGMANIGEKVEVLKAMQVLALWPLASGILLRRLIVGIRDRISGGHPGGRFKDMLSTDSLDFFWTSPTALDDTWILHELHDCTRSSVVKLHRYLTQESASDTENRRMPEFERGITRFGRPDWKDILSDIAKGSKNSKVIGIFFCGPEAMSEEIQNAAAQAMRDSIMRGLQAGAFRELAEIFGHAVPAGDFPNATSERGCNIRFVFREENFR